MSELASYFHPQVVKSVLALSMITVITFVEKVSILYHPISLSLLTGVIVLQLLFTPHNMVSLSLILFSIVFLVLIVSKFQR